ncbi:MAG: tetratricopeptide repeat protein, partial [Bacteroidota bacterium]
MKNVYVSILIYGLFTLSLTAQQNNSLSGKIVFLNSRKNPATGVELSGVIKRSDTDSIVANTVYSGDDGTYRLVFPKAAVGYVVQLTIGEKDGNGQAIEVVNDAAVRICRIPEDAKEAFEIIVCKKGERDAIAETYYTIIKSSSDVALAGIKKELEVLLNQKKKRYQAVDSLIKRIARLEKQADSIPIYKEAYRIASINKDKANDRVLKYLNLLEAGISIQQAREVLNIESASRELESGVSLFEAGINELETRASASMSIFDYKDAIRCYKTIITYAEEIGMDRLKMASYYHIIAILFDDDGNANMALTYGKRTLAIREEILDEKHPMLATSYNNIALTYRALGEYIRALDYHQRALAIRETVLDGDHPTLAISYHNIAVTYHALGKYVRALEYQKRVLAIWKAVLDRRNPMLATSYNNIAVTYRVMGKYAKALEHHQRALATREVVLDGRHPDLATSYNNIALTYKALGKYVQA